MCIRYIASKLYNRFRPLLFGNWQEMLWPDTWGGVYTFVGGIDGDRFLSGKASLSCPLRLWVGFGRTTFTVSSGLLQHLARCSFREVRTKLMGPRPFVQAFESQFRCAELPTEQDTTGKNEWIEIAEQGFLRSGATGDSPHVASNRRGMR